MMLARSGHGWWDSRGGSASHGSTGCSLLLQHRPVEGVVVLVVEGAEEDPEELPEIHVVGSLLEAETAAVVEIHRELGRKTFAENFHWSRHLLLADLLVLLFLGGGLQSLPRQTASVEIHQDVPQAFHVVTSALLNSKVSVD